LSIKEKILEFLSRIFPSILKEEEKLAIPMLEENPTEVLLEQIEEVEKKKEEEKINVAKRTLMTRFYAIEQEIAIFESDFPKEYQEFLSKINSLRDSYISSLAQTGKSLTFEIDPELDYNRIGEVVKLERDVKFFIESKVKFSILSKRLQRLITKLNILYNVSVFYFENQEKDKVRNQLEHALTAEQTIADELKNCEYILNDVQLKERIVSLMSYVDYIIFRASLRISDKSPAEVLEKLVILTKFEKFDYTTAFSVFIKDEISDLSQLIPLITDEECNKVLSKKLEYLLMKITYYNDNENPILDSNFWINFLDFETSLFEILKLSGVEKNKIKVKLIDRMEISVNENEVLTSPITNAYLNLTSLFSKTHDKRLLLLIKLIKSLSSKVTYREIYFLTVLFDALGVIKNTSNGFFKYIEKYLKKYPYDQSSIRNKKAMLISSSNKEYVEAFSINDYEKDLIATLENLSIDFKVDNNQVLINSFYFNGLENVFNSLHINNTNV